MTQSVMVNDELTAALALARIIKKEQEFLDHNPVSEVSLELEHLAKVKKDLLERNLLQNDQVKLVEIMMNKETIVFVTEGEHPYVKR